MTSTTAAANRFGLGARPGDLERIGEQPQHWLLDQLAGPSTGTTGGNTTAAVLVEVDRLRAERRERRRMNEEATRDYGRAVRSHYIDQVNARYRAAIESDTPFLERLVHFWSNHFAVSADKQPLPAVAGLYENEAIRPNVTGKFAELLLAVEQHPAMILYLDNQRSVGPNSALARRASRRENDREVGLNENLAREILELHTLGVDGGYTQQDVGELAAVISGWSIGASRARGRLAGGEPGTFEFHEAIHEPGARTVLGRRYAQSGIRQGEAVLRDLAVHPSTATNVCTKLARHFVADDPPAKLVDRMRDRFLASGGDLAVVYETLVLAKESWTDAAVKYKSPNDVVISTLRALEHVPASRRAISTALKTLGQTPFRPGSPAGWDDTADAWGGADALYKRIEWADSISRTLAGGRNPVVLGQAVLGGTFLPDTRTAVSRAESLQQGMTLLLASPEFQRR